MLCLMAVSLCHSLLEYPLWYVYFLAPFAVMMSLTPLPERGQAAGTANPWRWGAAALAALLAAQTLYYAAVYYHLAYAYGKPGGKWPLERQIMRLEQMEQNDYFLRYYAQMGLLRKVDVSKRPLPVWGREAALRASNFRPYANTSIRAFYLAQEGRHQEAAAWLVNMARYYPEQIPGYLNNAASFKAPQEVVRPLRGECLRHRAAAGKSAVCGTGADRP